MGWLGCAAEPDPIADAIVTTVADMVARSLGSTALVGVEQVTTDDTSVRYSSDVTGGGLWLTANDKLALRRFRCGGGLTSVLMVGERYSITPEV